jgi:hypothetical protein
VADTLERLVVVTLRYLSERSEPSDSNVTADSAVCQDLLIFGIDVDDYVGLLEEEFGKVVYSIPWGRFTDQTASFRGCGCIQFPFWLLWRLVRAAATRQPVIPRAKPRDHPERLTIAHIAAVIERGQWFEPQ